MTPHTVHAGQQIIKYMYHTCGIRNYQLLITGTVCQPQNIANSFLSG